MADSSLPGFVCEDDLDRPDQRVSAHHSSVHESKNLEILWGNDGGVSDLLYSLY
jgi:hypothetical protein